MINNTTVQCEYNVTDDVNTAYPITFQGTTNSSGEPLLNVVLTEEDGTTKTLTYRSGYTLVQEGLKLVSAEDAVVGNTLTITRNTPFKQEIDFQVGRIDPEQAEEAADLSVLRDQELRNDLSVHTGQTNNPHQTTVALLHDVVLTNLTDGQFLRWNGESWINSTSSATMSWGGLTGNMSEQTDLMNALNGKINTDGTSIMTGVLKMRASISFQCAIAPYWDGVGFYKLNDNGSVTLMASMESTQGFTPFDTNTYDIGMSSKKWKNLYLGGKAFVGTLNNGGDIAIPTSGGTLALLEDIYPVGSIYIGTQATCPLAALISNSTWTLVATKLLSEIVSAPVIGNGMTLGLWNGSSGLSGLGVNTNGGVGALASFYGTTLNTSSDNQGTFTQALTNAGVTTDSTKSGLVADVANSTNKTELTVNVWRRDA